MKCFKLLAVILFFIALIGCKDVEKRVFFDESDQYIGFNDADYGLTVKECIKSGFFVRIGLNEIKNRKVLEEFIKDSSKGKDSYIRMAYFDVDNNDKLYYKDLIYTEEGYSIFSDEHKLFNKDPYKHLLVLDYNSGIPSEEKQMVVLADNNTITYKKIMSIMLSSLHDPTNRVNRYDIATFNY